MTLQQEEKNFLGKEVQNQEKNKKRVGKKKLIRISQIKYKEKVVKVKRVTKVVKGGKKMTFQAIVIVGDEKRRVGVGIGRADDVNRAIDKAVLNAKKNFLIVPLTSISSIPQLIFSSYGASKLLLRPASEGTGVIAGGTVRTVLELAGLKNIVAKQFGSRNILNNAKATISALSTLSRKVEIGKAQSSQKRAFYNKIMKKFKNVQFFPEK